MTIPKIALYEPTPDYMQRLQMFGCRFVEGNTNEGQGPAGNDQQPVSSGQTAQDQQSDAEDSAQETEDEELGEGGKKALEAERKARKEAEAKLKKFEDAQKTELERAQESATETAARLESTEQSLWYFKALVEHPVLKEHRHMVKGTTEQEYLEAAKSIYQLTSRPGVVKESGTEGDGKSPAGSISEYRRQIAERKNNR